VVDARGGDVGIQPDTLGAAHANCIHRISKLESPQR
jgi:hypothetical protein